MFLLKCLLSVAIILASMKYAESGNDKPALRVEYKPRGRAPPRGCKCNGTELPGNNRGPREFVVKCEREGASKRFKEERWFKGNPHSCGAYNNKNNNGQERFYQELVDLIGDQMCKVCNPLGLQDVVKENGFPCPHTEPGAREFQTELCGNAATFTYEEPALTVKYTNIKAPRGCECDGSVESGEREFVVNCQREGDSNRFREQRRFIGNPHNCENYNNGGQGEFYQQLVDLIGREMCVVCNPPGLKDLESPPKKGRESGNDKNDREERNRKIKRDNNKIKQENVDIENGFPCPPTGRRKRIFQTRMCGKDAKFEYNGQ